jgi:hypothetical protein
MSHSFAPTPAIQESNLLLTMLYWKIPMRLSRPKVTTLDAIKQTGTIQIAALTCNGMQRHAKMPATIDTHTSMKTNHVTK